MKLKLYTNTTPVFIGFQKENGATFEPVGTTFVLLGVDNMGFILEPVKSFSDKRQQPPMSMHHDVFKFAFVEVMQLNDDQLKEG